MVGVDKDGKNPVWLGGFEWTHQKEKDKPALIDPKKLVPINRPPAKSEYDDLLAGFDK